MKFRNLHKWALSEALHGLVFFAQRFDELLFDYTLDSYRAQGLNPPYLCVEALKVIQDVEAGILDEANLAPVLEELTWSIRGDSIAKRLLDVDLDHYVLQHHDTPLQQKRLRIEVLGRNINPERYLVACMAALATAVNENAKSDIDHCARMLVTTLINRGVSKSFLYQRTREFFFSGEEPQIASPEAINTFLEQIVPVEHHFNIFFIVSSDVRLVQESIEAFSLRIAPTLPVQLAPFAAARGFAPEENEMFLEVEDITHFDCYSAREDAERRIDRLKDMFTLFFHRNELTWRSDALVSQCCIDGPQIVGPPKSSMTVAFDTNSAYASKRLNWMLQNISMRGNSSFRRFSRIVDLHGICVSNAVPENQLLNIWISLETLVPSQAGRNKIANVISALEPFIRVTYIRRLVDRALLDLMIWNRPVTTRLLRKVPNGRGLKLPQKLLLLLAVQDNEELRKEAYGCLKDFHLLRYRLYSLARSLSSPESALQLVDEHAKKVSWQIRRIYRTRNLLVHAGSTPSYLATLIENGHDYLDLTLNEIVERSCSGYNVETLEQAFELEKLLWQGMHTALSQAGTFDRSIVEALHGFRVL